MVTRLLCEQADSGDKFGSSNTCLIMSNLEYCHQLYQEYVETSQEFLNLNRELPHTISAESINKNSRYAAIKEKWQTALRKYWDFLQLLKTQGFNPNDEVQLS